MSAIRKIDIGGVKFDVRDGSVENSKLGDFVKATDVTVGDVTYHTYWKVAPTASNDVYGVAVHPTTGELYSVRSNAGTYSVTSYGGATTTSKTGTVQSSLKKTISAGTTVDNFVGMLLNNDTTLESTANKANTAVNALKAAMTTPESYGATGDGSHDDTEAINQALASGKNVEFDGSKTYKCNSYITIPNGSNVYGNGATIKFDPNATLDSVSSNVSVINAEDITIDGFKFDFSDPTNLHNAFTMAGCKRIRVNNCDFANNYGYVTRLNNNNDVIFSGCSFRNITGAGGNPGGAFYGVNWQNYVIENCSCDTLDDHFIYIDTGDNIKIVNCTVKKCGNNPAMPGAAFQLYGNTKNVIIDNCTDIDCGKDCFQLRDYTGGTIVPTNVTVSNHHSKNCGLQWFHGMGNGVDELHDIIIKDCYIENCKNEPIDVVECTNLIISGNIIKNIQTAGKYPISVAFVTNGIFSNNIIDAAADYGMLFGYGSGSCTGIVVEGNIFNKIVTACVYPRRMNDRIQLTGNRIMNTTPLFPANSNAAVLLTGEASSQPDKHSITFGDNTTAVLHYAGDIIFNKSPASGQPMGWICTATGAPGTLVAMPSL